MLNSDFLYIIILVVVLGPLLVQKSLEKGFERSFLYFNVNMLARLGAEDQLFFFIIFELWLISFSTH